MLKSGVVKGLMVRLDSFGCDWMLDAGCVAASVGAGIRIMEKTTAIRLRILRFDVTENFRAIR